MAANPMKWPSFEQLGRDFCSHLKPALDQLAAAGSEELDDHARAGLSKLAAWLDAPCVATVKLDGTNVGIDSTGLIVGRNVVVQPGATYQKVDVWKLLASYPDRVERLRGEFAKAAGKEVLSSVMLYGELVVNSKYDYSQAGIFKDWLCFAAMLRPGAEAEDGDEAAGRLAASLRASGYNAAVPGGGGYVVVVPNPKLEELLQHLGIRTISEAYRPVTSAQWADHDGKGSLPCFRSLRQLLVSEWARRFLLPSEGRALGEGLVVASEADGRLFKWKHSGEDLGKVPDQLREAVEALRGLAGSSRAGLLPPGLLEVFERLLLVATAPSRLAKGEAPGKADSGTAGEREEDAEALAVWASTLTKFDVLEATFEQGSAAKAALEMQLSEQVALDLQKDYQASKKDAAARATKVVRKEMGKRFGTWKRASSSGA